MEKAILRTLIYADLFDFPLTGEELWQRLIWEGKSSSAQPSEEEFETCLRKLNRTEKIERQKSFYFLSGRGRIVESRKKHLDYSQKKLKKAVAASRFLKLIPLVRLVAVTGSVASENAKHGDDIDLFLITSAGRIWTTRFLVTLLVSLLGVRRRPGQKKFKDKICLNLYLDEGHLGIFKKEQDLFLAYEIYQLKVLWQRGETYQKFLSANTWIKKLLPNGFDKKLFKFKEDHPNRFNYLSRVSNSLWGRVEKTLYLFQLWWMRKKRTTETAKSYLIAFHPADERSRILERFKQKTFSIDHLPI